MSPPLSGRTIGLAEGRQLEELAQMLEKEGATILRCPMVSILDARDEAPILSWLRDLIANRFDYVVFLTGEGIRRLLGFAERAGLRAEVLAALGQARAITRGPKPVRALKEIGLAPFKIADAPTTDGVIATLRMLPLQGKIVGVQMYSETNPPLAEYLAAAGAGMVSVLPYVYAPGSDAERVADLIRSCADGKVAAVVFTSSPQVDRLYEVAQERCLQAELDRAWQHARVAAVGPIVADNLRQRGAPVHICPEQGFVMKNLVKHIKDALSAG